MNEKLLIAALTALLISGCASTPAAQSEAAAPVAEKAATKTEAATDGEVVARTESSKDAGDRVICRTITPTGSHRKKTICRTVSDIKSDRDAAQDALKGNQGTPVDPSN